jgi:hypothetical protein
MASRLSIHGGIAMAQRANADTTGFFHFTGPARLSRAVHDLEGILLGITADSVVTGDELVRLAAWLGEYGEFSIAVRFARLSKP